MSKGRMQTKTTSEKGIFVQNTAVSLYIEIRAEENHAAKITSFFVPLPVSARSN